MRLAAVVFLAFLLLPNDGFSADTTTVPSALLSLRAAAEQGDAKALAALLAKGEQGDVKAELELGEFFYHGVRPPNAPVELVELHYSHFIPGTTKDYDEALKWFRKAADQNNAVAEERVGAMYKGGKGVNLGLNHSGAAAALPWFRKAAAQGNADAEYWLGKIYSSGFDVPRDLAETTEWYRKAAVQGNPVAQTAVGLNYQSGWGVKKDYAEAMKWFQEAADQEYADAQNRIGKIYEAGEGVAQDKVKASMWFILSAANDDGVLNRADIDRVAKEMSPEQIAEGKRLAIAWGVAHAPAESRGESDTDRYYGVEYASVLSPAMEALKAAAMKGDVKTFAGLQSLAEIGNVEAQLELGGLYEHDLTNYPVLWTVDQDHAEAEKWYRKAADQGNPQAMFRIGALHAGQNESEAIKWFRKAADRGYLDAISMMGGRYEYGFGVPQDYAEAVKWYRRAADRGQFNAQIQLGKMYQGGLGGLKRDYEEAYYWQLVAEIKSTDGRSGLPGDYVEKHLTSEQMTAAWKRMKEWKPAPAPPEAAGKPETK